MQTCIEPPEIERNPGSWPGFQTEQSVNNSDGAPERDSFDTIVDGTPKVKPHPQQVVDNGSKNARDSVVLVNGLSPDQYELLSRVLAHSHRFALLLALDNELRPEHCDEQTDYDGWDEEMLRRANKFS